MFGVGDLLLFLLLVVVKDWLFQSGLVAVTKVDVVVKLHRDSSSISNRLLFIAADVLTRKFRQY